MSLLRPLDAAAIISDLDLTFEVADRKSSFSVIGLQRSEGFDYKTKETLKSMSGVVFGRADSSICYSLRVTNPGDEPLRAGLRIEVPMTAIGPNTLQSTLHMHVHDENGGGVSVVRSFPGGLQTCFVGEGPNFTLLPVDLGGDIAVAGPHDFDVGTGAPLNGPELPNADALILSMAFILSPGDRVDAQGRVLIDQGGGEPCTIPPLPLTKDQEKCVNVMNKNLGQVVKTIGKEVCACIKDHNKGKKGVVDIEQCVAADRKGKIQKAKDKTVKDDASKCLGVDRSGLSKTPAAFYTGAAGVNGAAMEKEHAILDILYGDSVGAAAITEADDKNAAKCQEAVGKTLKKCLDTKFATFAKCKKTALKDGSDPVACVLADPKGKIAKACDLLIVKPNGKLKVDKLRAVLAKKCVGKAVDLAIAFPHCGSTDLEVVHACIETPIECAVCLAINSADEIGADCDLLDDDSSNGSCAVPW